MCFGSSTVCPFDVMAFAPLDVSVIVPVVAIIFIFSIPLLAIWTDYRKNRAMIEKGLAAPEKRQPRWHETLAWGLVLTFVGIALLIASFTVRAGLLLPGLIVPAIGIALLIYTAIIKRQKTEE